MPTPQEPTSNTTASRAEKLSLLSSMLGPDAMERVRKASASPTADAHTDPVEMDADRAAWHRNRLLQRLRQQGRVKGNGEAEGPAPTLTPAKKADADPQVQTAPPRQAPIVAKAGLDARLSKISDPATLGQEHPAIIARLIKGLSRDARVEALKSLPGPIARSIVRRLR